MKMTTRSACYLDGRYVGLCTADDRRDALDATAASWRTCLNARAMKCGGVISSQAENVQRWRGALSLTLSACGEVLDMFLLRNGADSAATMRR